TRARARLPWAAMQTSLSSIPTANTRSARKRTTCAWTTRCLKESRLLARRTWFCRAGRCWWKETSFKGAPAPANSFGEQPTPDISDRLYPKLLSALALIQTPSDFRGCPRGGSILERGAAGEHPLVIGIYFPCRYAHP